MASLTATRRAAMGRMDRRQQKIGYGFVMPAAIIMVALIVYPMLYGVYLSFFNTNLVTKWDYVGLKYYEQAVTKPEFASTVLLTFKFMLLVVAGHFLLGFLLASFLNKEFKGRLAYRIIFMLPWLFPETVVALLFTWIMNPMYGVLNAILRGLGLISGNVSWLGTAELAFPSVVFACIWKGYPLVMTMILAGMQSISHDLYEASYIDGANRWQQFLHVTVPSLRPVLTTTLILDSVWWFKQYTLVYTMTAGGPGSATSLVSLNIFSTAFESLRFGKASAWAVIVFFICYLIAKVYRVVLKDD